MKNLVKVLSILTLLVSNAFADGNGSFNQTITFSLDDAMQEVQSLSDVTGLSRVGIRANRKQIRTLLYDALYCSRDKDCIIVSEEREVLPGSKELQNFFNEGWSVAKDLDNSANLL